MKKLWGLAGRILLLNSAIMISVAWIFSQWYVGDIYLGASRHQAFIHCDSGGWYADVRHYPDMVVAWDFILSSSPIDHDGRGFSFRTPSRESLIDAFDAAGMWKLSVPGVRYLSNSGVGARGRGSQSGIAVRHWVLFAFTMLTICGWCYWRSIRRKAGEKNDGE